MILKKIKQKKADPLESAVSFGYYKKIIYSNSCTRTSFSEAASPLGLQPG